MDVLRGLFIFLALKGVLAKKGFGPGEQDWGHIEVRQGAHLFYWLYYVQDASLKPEQAPTILWLEGGGVDSTGFGNFADIGPIFPDGKIRNTSWVKNANIIFLDNPVGVGLSYVDDLKYLTKTRQDVSNDLVTFLKKLLIQHPILKKTPFHVVGRVYGGTFAVTSAKSITDAIKKGELEMKLESITMMGVWLDPQNYYMAYSDILKFKGMIDQPDEVEIKRLAGIVHDMIEKGKWSEGMDSLSDLLEYMRLSTFGREMLNTISEIDFDVDFKDNPVAAGKLHHPLPNKEESAALLSSDSFRTALGISKSLEFNKHGYTAIREWDAHLLIPNTESISYLLDNTDVKVFVVYGQFNVYFNAVGGRDSLNNLQWSGASEWKKTAVKPFIADGVLQGYSKSVKNLRFLVIDRAGHMIPSDNPRAASELLKEILGK